MRTPGLERLDEVIDGRGRQGSALIQEQEVEEVQLPLVGQQGSELKRERKERRGNMSKKAEKAAVRHICSIK